MTDDTELLGRYAKSGSEKAFAELVSRHLPLVYSAALRQVGGDHELAQDVAQTVFIDLARKAGSLARHEVLTGWLYTSTRFAARTALRTEHRRQAREQLAAAMQTLDKESGSNSDWEQITPLLDAAMHELEAEERNAVLLRFFEKKALKEVGAALGVSEDAARMRVTRAVDRLHALLTARGAPVSAGALATLLAAGAVSAAPAGLAATVTGAALAGGAAAGGGLLQGLVQALRAKWALVALPGVVGVALMGAIYANTRAREAAPQRVAQVAAPAATPKRPAAGPEQPAAPAATPVTKPAGDANHMRFQLVDAETGSALTGAKVRVTYFYQGGEMKGVKLETGADGSVLVELPKKPCRGANLFATADGHVPKSTRWDAGEMPEDYTMKLEGGMAIGGVVVDESQRPVAGVRVEFHGPGIDLAKKENISFGPDTTQTTDAEGHWRCNLLPRDFEDIAMVLTHSNYAATPTGAAVNPEQSTNLVLVLKAGARVAGVVTDGGGNPLAGASVRQVHNFQQPKLSSKTDAAGRFELKHVRAGELMLAVQAEGFSPVVLETNVAAQPVELAFALEPGHLFKGRVVDQAGRPIPNAVVRTDSDNQGLRKLEWSARTDANGRFEWNSAPAEGLLYWIEADGYDWARERLLKADGSEHEIRLARKGSARTAPAVRITGTVVDEETGAPLDGFKVLVGAVELPFPSPDFAFGTEGANGAFSLPLNLHRPAPQYAVAVEKEGYLPVASTNLWVRDGNQVLGFKLRKGSGPVGLVVLPGGQPVVEATVFMYGERGGVYMDKPGEFRKGGVTTANRAQTDGTGRFTFAPKLDARGFIVIHEQGYAEVGLAEFSGTIVLQPWGRVEGRVLVGNRPATNETISLGSMIYRYGQNGRLFPPLSLWLDATTDSEGRFVFEKVPPGERKICRRVTRPDQHVGRIFESHGKTIAVAAGGVTRADLGGSGRAVTGRASFGGKPVDWRSVPIELELKMSRPGGDSRPQRGDFLTTEAFISAIKAFSEADKAFWTSAAGRELEQSRRSYAAFCREDGSFEVLDAVPGTYELKIQISETSKNSIGPSPVAFERVIMGELTREVVIPESGAGQAGEPVDLGVLELAAPAGGRP